MEKKYPLMWVFLIRYKSLDLHFMVHIEEDRFFYVTFIVCCIIKGNDNEEKLPLVPLERSLQSWQRMNG